MLEIHCFVVEFLMDFRIVFRLIQHNKPLDELLTTASRNCSFSVYDSSSTFEATYLQKDLKINNFSFSLPRPQEFKIYSLVYSLIQETSKS